MSDGIFFQEAQQWSQPSVGSFEYCLAGSCVVRLAVVRASLWWIFVNTRVCHGRKARTDKGRFHETSYALVSAKQSFGIQPQLIIASTGSIQKGASLRHRVLQSLNKYGH
jgi:hypothetical protein